MRTHVDGACRAPNDVTAPRGATMRPMQPDLAVVGPGSVGIFFAAHAAVSAATCSPVPGVRSGIRRRVPVRAVPAPAHVVTDPAQRRGPAAVRARHAEVPAHGWCCRLAGRSVRTGHRCRRGAERDRGAGAARAVRQRRDRVAGGRVLRYGALRRRVTPCTAARVGSTSPRRGIRALRGALRRFSAEIAGDRAVPHGAWRKLGLNATSNGITASRASASTCSRIRASQRSASTCCSKRGPWAMPTEPTSTSARWRGSPSSSPSRARNQRRPPTTTGWRASH